MLGILFDRVDVGVAIDWAGEEVRKESAIWLEVMPVFEACIGAGAFC